MNEKLDEEEIAQGSIVRIDLKNDLFPCGWKQIISNSQTHHIRLKGIKLIKPGSIALVIGRLQKDKKYYWCMFEDFCLLIDSKYIKQI